MRIYVLASGSDGNATVFESGDTRVLVDGGIGPGALVQRLVDLGAGGMPQAILVTHAHQDHVGQTARIAKKLRIPVYALEETVRAARLGDRLPPRAGEAARVRVISAREPFVVGALTIAPVPVPHDAEEVAFRVDDGVHSAAIATDLGEITSDLVEHVRGCDAVLIEANHDLGLLRAGPYPAFLKRRVESARGHLSNAQTHELLQRLGVRTRAVALLHLSRSNNTPELALEVARDALAGRRVHLTVAEPRSPFVLDLDDALPHPLPARPMRRRMRAAPEQLAFSWG